LRQAKGVAEKIHHLSPHVEVEQIIVKTSGDERSEFGDHAPEQVGEFSSALERELIHGKVDFVVHSAKDLPTKIPQELVVEAYPERVDPRDVVLVKTGHSFQPGSGAVVGTGSPRREMLWKNRWPESSSHPIRGNVDRRMQRLLREDKWWGILLAAAGVERLGGPLEGLSMERLGVDWMTPAPGQGALAVECRTKDNVIREILRELDQTDVRACVTAEKGFLQKWGGGCSESLGAFAQILSNGTLHLQVAVSGAKGGIRRGQMEGPITEPELLGVRLAEEMQRG
jgi:hydroxymethylbilane synthase